MAFFLQMALLWTLQTAHASPLGHEASNLACNTSVAACDTRDESSTAEVSEETFHLRNTDFEKGTLIIQRPGTYILDEDIVFEPKTDQMLPPLGDSVYSPQNGYWLGFFAAISVNASDVVIDLNGKNIKMSYKFASTQRFFSIIELGSKPFIAKVGPPQFKKNEQPLFSANNVTIKNGLLGLSSHMGIHGNDNTGIRIKDLVIRDFETGGIQLNGAEDVEISSCMVGPSLGAPGTQKVPGLATLSQSMLLLSLARGLGHEQDEPIRALRNFTERFLNNQDDAETAAVFRDPSLYNGLPDGSSLYGILFHKIGPAIHDFGACTNSDLEMLSGDPLQKIRIRDTIIKDLHLKSDEVVKMVVQNKPVLGPAGDLVQVARLRDNNDNYMGNVLSDAQAHLARLKLEDTKRNVNDDLLFKRYGSTNIPNQVLRWMSGEGTWIEASDGAEFHCDVDSMSHFNKGVVGMRLEFVTDVELHNVSISGLQHFGERSPFDHLCTKQGAEYHGSDVRGISIGGGLKPSDLDPSGYVVDSSSFYSANGTATEIVDEGTTVSGCNWQCYLDRYSDLSSALGANNTASAEKHFLSFGASEGRDCTCQIPALPGACNWQCYLDRYPDLTSALGTSNTASAAKHFQSAGQSEGRDCTCPSPAPSR